MLIGIAGFAGVGKDTAASFLAPRHLVRLDERWVDVAPYTSGHDPSAAYSGRSIITAPVDPAKEMLYTLTGADPKLMWGPSEARSRPTGGLENTREPLKHLGDSMRAYNADVWIAAVVKRAKAFMRRRPFKPVEGIFQASWAIEEAPYVVINGVRYVNEARYIRERDGVVIRIKRAGYGPHSDHPTETEQTSEAFGRQVDFEVDNDFDLTTLCRSMYYIMKELRL